MPGSSTDHFTSARLHLLREIEPWHFWFVGRRAFINRLLDTFLSETSRPVLDLGCGTGFMLNILTNCGYHMIGLDMRPEGLQDTRQRLPQALLTQASAIHLPFQNATLAAVLMLDTLEHMEEEAVLSEVYRTVKPGGIILISVPAMPWLWSYRDVAAGHLRRYTRRTLQKALHHAHFKILHINYYQFFLFPMVVLSRILGRQRPETRDMEDRSIPFINIFLCWVNRMEVWLSRFIRWPLGSSLIVVCRRD